MHKYIILLQMPLDGMYILKKNNKQSSLFLFYQNKSFSFVVNSWIHQ